MDRRHLLLGLGVGLLGAHPIFAASYQDSLVAQLREQGYDQILVDRTWLGRVRISAILGDHQREIILNPRTGEVLRDVIFNVDGVVLPQIERASGKSVSRPASGTTSGSGSVDGSSDNSSTGSDGSSDGSSDDSSDDSGSDHSSHESDSRDKEKEDDEKDED